MERPIGIIDSGVGGLTVVKEMCGRLPNEKVVYIGDSLRCPYGPRSAEEVRKYTFEMASALSKMDIKMLVIACNTATAVALDHIRAHFNFPVIGVIKPGARAAVNASTTKRIVVLGTSGTINSGAYDEEIKEQSKNAQVFPLACPEFVQIVESGQYKSQEASLTVKRTLQVLAEKEFDAAILGCTHYPLLEHHIKNHLPQHVEIISSAVETVIDVQKMLIEKECVSNKKECVSPTFYTTGRLTPFRATVCDWLKLEKPDVQSITL